jgi:hypothetical protein
MLQLRFIGDVSIFGITIIPVDPDPDPDPDPELEELEFVTVVIVVVVTVPLVFVVDEAPLEFIVIPGEITVVPVIG